MMVTFQNLLDWARTRRRYFMVSKIFLPDKNHEHLFKEYNVENLVKLIICTVLVSSLRFYAFYGSKDRAIKPFGQLPTAHYISPYAQCVKITKKVSLLNKFIFIWLFKNYSKCHIWIFGILGFSTNFCPIKTVLSGNTVWPQASGFQKLAKMDHFWHF